MRKVVLVPTALLAAAVIGFFIWNFLLLSSHLAGSAGETRMATLLEQVENSQQQIIAQQQQIQQLMERDANRQAAPCVQHQSEGTKADRRDDPPVPTLEDNNNTPAVVGKQTVHSAGEPIAVLVIACNRPDMVRCVDRLLKFRPSERFPIIISQDCGDASTAATIREHYGNQVIHVMQPELEEIPEAKHQPQFKGYYKISRHYKWALTQVFDVLFFNSVIIVEDDLEISEDFFDYFAAGRQLMEQDETLWCVSAWNDNGKSEFVSSAKKLYRTDFFPGLGWMLTRGVWSELSSKWPKAFWDDWMREPAQRANRACIRPDISRVSNFGERGVSAGQFFYDHIAKIKRPTETVPFLSMDLSYLLKDKYDPAYRAAVKAARTVRFEELLNSVPPGTGNLRVEYTSNQDFERKSSELGLMSDLKAGVPRTGYMGIVEFMYKGNRVYLSPPSDWSGYHS
ncbi:alpha-1,3-mannosyl-glycoprotein 2-beta-N-acetylglucosaminyltransferase [Capsaspora owczarzaki ATCC 30864]|uniref:alpha-1,3-mannosyl-glycoprotein 2-beta-N-acetylglucosaminyltransferase n=1 Tax=Capsaspora owczarzaki (strain ATCC 30864) TaxID=595528 RepID=A0A0D2WPY5_CAPO3|nr:alpha-1,3-mannosyl-glycoprotein 2-beta-N-acetylglucosaminyltransferase [Capsaspora owczarzaki ATCC 30864]KJE92893.1 alpha-1,3-mannosyl-glycoprotein 2-beta-N-acetylglucosaminyltransferase [Capsaspora owczarzaki ATCC 30864]|eukprot:XP_004363508.1 alpha-1,3-mannosyl-glycoprotein 2-beta-N-acetylglucosaminyltransferase [Capsaspora owczarzaki ATCC 30864]